MTNKCSCSWILYSTFYAFRQWADKGTQATQRAKEGAWANKARAFEKG